MDNDPVTGNVRLDDLEAAFVPGKTKAIMMAHTLGNPFDFATVVAFCRKNNLWLVEDNYDGLGSTYWLHEEHPLVPAIQPSIQNLKVKGWSVIQGLGEIF